MNKINSHSMKHSYSTTNNKHTKTKNMRFQLIAKSIVLLVCALILFTINTKAQTFKIECFEGHEYTYKPSIAQRLTGTRKVVIIVPREQSPIDNYYYTSIYNYFRRIGIPTSTYPARFKKNQDMVGNIRVIWGTLEEDISDSWNDSNTLLIVANVVSSYGYYTGEENRANIQIIDPVNDFTWSLQFDMPNHEERFDKKLKELISPAWNFNKNNLIIPKYYCSNWKEQDFKNYFSSSDYHVYEGVYEGDSYKVGVKQGQDGNFYLIYFDGAVNTNDWTEGDVKAILRPTATPAIFKATWFGMWKNSLNYTIIFKDGLMTTYNENKEEKIYIKLYPALLGKQEDRSNEWSGTGFALKNNHIVTNYHVIEGANTIKVQGINGDFDTKYNANVVATDKFNDIAILKVDGVTIQTNNIPYAIKTSTADVGEDVFVLGYPLTSTMGEEIKLTTGVVSSKTGFQGDVSLYQISAPVQPGNSGGPLFDGTGNIIGIVSAKHEGAENVGYALKTSYLRNLMESVMTENILPQANKIASYKLSDKVKSLKNYVYYITCSSTENSKSNYNAVENSSSARTYYNPHINRKMDSKLKVISVSVQDNQTVITFSNNNLIDGGGYYQWFTLDKNAYIATNGQKYKLIRAEGIAIYPEKTYYSYAGETKTFTLYFPAIPKNSTSIDFIESEDSEWRLYGIQLM